MAAEFRMKNLSAVIVCCSLFLSVSTCSASENGSVIDLSRPDSGDVVVVSAPVDSAEIKRTVLLPDFLRFCHVAADSEHFRWIGASNRMYPWVGHDDLVSVFRYREPHPPIIKTPNSRAIVMLFELNEGHYLCLMPLSGEHSASWLEIQDTGALIVGTSTLGNHVMPHGAEIPLFAWSTGEDPYAALRNMWECVIERNVSGGNTSLRSEKEYPEEFRYLGWCTWEQYKHGIDESTVLNAIHGIERSDIPVRWVLIDDGHQQAVQQRMMSLSPNREKFPRGWGPIISTKRQKKIRWIGVWHTLLMNWKGIDVNHQMAFAAPYLMQHPKSSKTLIPRDNLADSRKFYSEFIGRVQQQGFDFVKVDNMSRSTIDYYGTRNAAKAQKNNIRSLEDSCRATGLGLINCSAQNTIGLLNAKHSVIMRTSPDYKRGALATSKSQILQSTFNTCWLGQTFWPDHDMFHSSDSEVAETMAITKAMSGGPIYLSDRPEDFDEDVIAPLCYEDGLLIRPEAPGVPAAESLFSDPLYQTEGAHKVFAPLKNRSCAIALYNLSLSPSVVRGTIVPNDYRAATAMLQPYEGPWLNPTEGLVVYNWGEGRGELISSHGLSVELREFGHKLFLLCPIRKGWAIVGRPDKYLSPSTVQIEIVEDDSIVLTMHEPAPIIVYSDSGVPHGDGLTVVPKGNGFYLCSFSDHIVSGVDIRVLRRK